MIKYFLIYILPLSLTYGRQDHDFNSERWRDGDDRMIRLHLANIANYLRHQANGYRPTLNWQPPSLHPSHQSSRFFAHSLNAIKQHDNCEIMIITRNEMENYAHSRAHSSSWTCSRSFPPPIALGNVQVNWFVGSQSASTSTYVAARGQVNELEDWSRAGVIGIASWLKNCSDGVVVVFTAKII